MKGVSEITVVVQALASEVRNSSGGGRYCGIGICVPVYKPKDCFSMMDELKKRAQPNLPVCDFQRHLINIKHNDKTLTHIGDVLSTKIWDFHFGLYNQKSL